MSQNNTVHIIGIGVDAVSVAPTAPVVCVRIYGPCEYSNEYYE